MQFARSPLGGALLSLAILLMALPAAGLEKPRLRVDDYVINADLTPAKHHLRAVAQVKFTALDDISAAVFELHNGLRVISVTSSSGAKLPVERFSQENAVRVSLPDTLSKDSSSTLTFTYEGNLASADDSPVEGLKLAYIGEDISYLLYAGRWFPVSGYGVNRFTARINVAVPAGYTVIGSGKVVGGNFAGGVEETAGEEEKSEAPALRRKGAAAKAAETPRRKTGPFSAPGKTVFSFAWEKNSFPGTIIAGKFEQAPAPANSNVHVFFNAAHKQFAPPYAETAAGEAGLQEAMKDIEVGALAYDNIPLASIGKLDPFSPEAQSLASDKGAMLFSMLHWVLGDANYNKTIRQFNQLYAGKPVSTEDLKKIAEQNSGGQLNWFFAQWLDSTGAPEFSNKYTVYRLGTGKGFRVTGEIKQDLDLFRMPVELKIDTDGKPETRRIDVAGTDSPYSVETYGQPRKITVDPNNRVLKNSPELKLRVAILKGEQLVQQGDLAAALTQLQKALDINKLSSLAHYRVAEVFFQQ